MMSTGASSATFFPSSQTSKVIPSSSSLPDRALLPAAFLVPVARHHPVAQHLVGRFDRVCVDREFLPPRVLRHQFQTKLIILEPFRAKIANRFSLFQRPP